MSMTVSVQAQEVELTRPRFYVVLRSYWVRWCYARKARDVGVEGTAMTTPAACIPAWQSFELPRLIEEQLTADRCLPVP